MCHMPYTMEGVPSHLEDLGLQHREETEKHEKIELHSSLVL